jgi:glutamyl-tRNA synthetase
MAQMGPFYCPGDRKVYIDLSFYDELAGPVSQQLGREVGDFVVKRADQLFAYQLAVVVDDALMGITDVVRGADLLDSTPRQIALFQALGFAVPRFWHAPLMLDTQGKRLSKRDGSNSLSLMRDAGVGPEKVVGQLAASVGLVPAGKTLTPTELLKSFDLERFRKCIKSNLPS